MTEEHVTVAMAHIDAVLTEFDDPSGRELLIIVAANLCGILVSYLVSNILPLTFLAKQHIPRSIFVMCFFFDTSLIGISRYFVRCE